MCVCGISPRSADTALCRPAKRRFHHFLTKKGSKTGRFGCHGETLWRNAHFCPTSAHGINALDADIETFEKLPELFAESLPDFI